MSAEKKRRRTCLGMAACFGAMGLFEMFSAHRAQINHTVLNYKGSWFTPEVGYVVSFCFFAMPACLIVLAFRRSHDQKD
jgi:hypothetical protein